MKVLELVGPKSFGALRVFSSLVMGIKMLPIYFGESYTEFLARVHEMSPKDQEKVIREALQFVSLTTEEIEGICCFAADPNGVAYNSANLRSMKLPDIFNIVVAVCLEVAKIDVSFVSEDEKKKLKTSPSMSGASSQSTPH